MFKLESCQVLCEHCDKPTLHHRNVRYPNHVLHLLLSLFTLGLWVPIWILLAIVPDSEPWRCSVCGSAGETDHFWLKLAAALVIGIPLMLFLAYAVNVFLAVNRAG